MHNIFLMYIPVGNPEAVAHYRDTIQQKVAFDRIARYATRETAGRLRRIFGDRPIAVWGSRDTAGNRPKFDRMAEGDDLLIVEGDTIKLMGKVALKTVNPDLSRELWKNINPSREEGWDLIYFIANPAQIDVPFKEFCRLFGYESNYQLRGFTAVADDKVRSFYARYDDLYSILLRIRAGESVLPKLPSEVQDGPPEYVEVPDDELQEVERSGIVSPHVRMQCALARLGIKSGAKVWIPVSDQERVRRACSFSEFESEFAAGIDLPKSYIENIDVVWKDEFRIDAAFEVEHSTVVYSGLLRFADLTILAPNSTYPLFVVAPVERKNRVREQLLRPTFRRLEFRKSVLFLPYNEVEKVDIFFENAQSGMSVQILRERAELLL